MDDIVAQEKPTSEPGKLNYRPPVATVLLVLLCFLSLTFTWRHFWNTNEYSRVFLTRALIDHQSLSIDKIIVTHDTQDKSLFGKIGEGNGPDEGQSNSDKGRYRQEPDQPIPDNSSAPTHLKYDCGR